VRECYLLQHIRLAGEGVGGSGQDAGQVTGTRDDHLARDSVIVQERQQRRVELSLEHNLLYSWRAHPVA
jgi:hypothetical protein